MTYHVTGDASNDSRQFNSPGLSRRKRVRCMKKQRIWYSSERFGQVSLVVSYEKRSRLKDYDERSISQVCPLH